MLGYDMTTRWPSPSSKYVLASTFDDPAVIRERMTQNLRGELTPQRHTTAQAHGPAGASGLDSEPL